MPTDHTPQTEKEASCACRWNRDAAGRPEFRECSEHYVARVFLPGQADPS